jgi:flagellar biosynthetic protein FliR
VGLGFSITVLLIPLLRTTEPSLFSDVIPFGIGVVSELILGVIIGLSVQLVFAGIQLAGQLAGFQMGFSIVNVMDPLTSAQVSIVAQLKNLIAMLIFLAINAHHWFLRSLVESFRLVPPFGFHYSASLMEYLMRLGGNMFVIAIKVGAPVMVALLLTSVALGLVARTVPQMNIFIVAFPLKIVIGLLFLAFSLPYLMSFLKQLFGGLGNDILMLLKTVA